MGQRTLTPALIATLLLLVLAAGAAWWFLVHAPTAAQRQAEVAVAAYAETWTNRDWQGLMQRVLPPEDGDGDPPWLERGFIDQHEASFDLAGALQVEELDVAAGPVDLQGERAEAPLQLVLALRGLGVWEYESRLHLVRHDGDWLVDWSPAVIHPELGEGQRLARSRSWPERAEILGHDGTPLVTDRDVVEVGFEPRRVEDEEALTAVLAAHAGVDRGALERLLAGELVPDWWYPVTHMRPDAYEEVRAELLAVPGVEARQAILRLPPSDPFAHHVLGHVGEITAELLEQYGAPYVVGDVVGLAGLERVYERRLAGEPSGSVLRVDASRNALGELHVFPGVTPEPVHTTLDVLIQEAVETALAARAEPAAMVAIDAATGELRAMASQPLTAGLNRAAMDQFAPGSTFKVVTAAALLAAGLESADTVSCPRTATISGRIFRNVDHVALGEIPFRTAFTESCNTAFVQLSAGLPAGSVQEAAEAFGFNVAYGPDLPLTVLGGRFTTPTDPATLVAAAIGQADQVRASPVHMASVAAAVASGSWRAPRLLVDEGPDQVRSLDEGVAAELRELMLATVAEGTGRAAAVPGREVAGKTGTAEFGAGDPPDAHAWFIGYSEGIAFAIFVEGGGSGGGVAAPLARTFLTALQQPPGNE